MPWVSNRSGFDIIVTITNTSGGSADNYTVKPAILYVTATSTVPESKGSNYWWRDGAETITVTAGEKTFKFEVQANDHVNIYTNSYETYPAKFGWF
jgi:hypothetical protein